MSAGILAALLMAGCGSVGSRPPNVILVGMDTLRADHLGVYGYDRPTSPSLDRFAGSAVVFEQAYSQANETLFSFASLFSSRLPSEIAPITYDDFGLPPTLETFPTILGVYGYRSGAFTCGGNLHHAFGFDRGYEVYVDTYNFGSFRHTVPPALAWVDSLPPDQPFYLFVHGYDAHAPYDKPFFFNHLFGADPGGLYDTVAGSALETEKIWNDRYYPKVSPQGMKRRNERGVRLLGAEVFSLLSLQDPAEGIPFPASEQAHVRDHYDGSVAYADLQVGLLLQGLQDRGLLDRSLVILVGDHGEDLFEHGHVNHRISLHDASTHVPMMIRFPRGEYGGQRVSDLVENVDLLPTVLEWLGFQVPAYAQGRSLLPLVRGQAQASAPAVSEGVLNMASVRSSDRRLVVSGAVPGTAAFLEALERATPGSPGVALFAVGPGEERRLDLAEPGPRAQAQDLLQALKDRYQGAHFETGARAPYVDPELQRIMQEKGYW